jgi:hypothetical protein
LFTDASTGLDSVIYRAGQTGYRIASTAPRLPSIELEQAHYRQHHGLRMS